MDKTSQVSATQAVQSIQQENLAVMDRDRLAVTPEGRRVQATVTPFGRRYGEEDKSARAATMAAQSASATVFSLRQLAVLADRPITSIFRSLSDRKTSGHGE